MPLETWSLPRNYIFSNRLRQQILRCILPLPYIPALNMLGIGLSRFPFCLGAIMLLASLFRRILELITDKNSPFDARGDDADGAELFPVPSLSDVDPMSTYWESYEAMRPIYAKNLG